MQIEVTTKMGNVSYKFFIDEPDAKTALHKAIILGNPPQFCQECSNEDKFRLDTNKDKEGNIYINVLCPCGAKAKLGSYKTGGFFWHSFEKYIGKNAPQEEPKGSEW